jgi:hypothetical protein
VTGERERERDKRERENKTIKKILKNIILRK